MGNWRTINMTGTMSAADSAGINGDLERDTAIEGQVLPPPPCIVLFSDGLLSKWGFDDGNTPDTWYDYCDGHGIDWREVRYPLVRLVREVLLPALNQAVEVVEISTIHNPIRAQTIDGVNVEDRWYEVDSGVHLTPESIEVPMWRVMELALR